MVPDVFCFCCNSKTTFCPQNNNILHVWSGRTSARWVRQSWVLGLDLQPACHWTNVLMLFIGLVHSQRSRRVDGPLGLMGNSIILRGPGLADTSGQRYPIIDRLSPSRATLMLASIQCFICLWNIDIGCYLLSEMRSFILMERKAFGEAGKRFLLGVSWTERFFFFLRGNQFYYF